MRPRPAASRFRRAQEQASAGDTLLLSPGLHPGPIRIRVPLTLRGAPGAILDGGGEGSVLTLETTAVVEDVEIRGSGRRVITVDSGVRVLSAPNVQLRRLRLDDVLYGVSVER